MATPSSAGVYRPRRPERTVLYRVLSQHFERYLVLHDERFERTHGPLRPGTRKTVYRYLDCGIFECGVARARCGECGHDLFVAFSCKLRCLCPSCHQKREILWADWAEGELLEDVPHRQVVFTIPKRLRPFFRYDRKLLGELASCAWRALRLYFAACLDDEDAVPGAVGFLQSSRELLNFHPHVHVLVTDGGWDADGTFHPLGGFDSSLVERIFRGEGQAPRCPQRQARGRRTRRRRHPADAGPRRGAAPPPPRPPDLGPARQEDLRGRSPAVFLLRLRDEDHRLRRRARQRPQDPPPPRQAAAAARAPGQLAARRTRPRFRAPRYPCLSGCRSPAGPVIHVPASSLWAVPYRAWHLPRLARRFRSPPLLLFSCLIRRKSDFLHGFMAWSNLERADADKVVSLLAPDMVPTRRLSYLMELERLDDADLEDGTPCFRVTGKEPSGGSVTIWIDRSTYFVRRITRPSRPWRYIDFDPELDPVIAAQELDFGPPEWGARERRKFQWADIRWVLSLVPWAAPILIIGLAIGIRGRRRGSVARGPVGSRDAGTSASPAVPPATPACAHGSSAGHYRESSHTRPESVIVRALVAWVIMTVGLVALAWFWVWLGRADGLLLSASFILAPVVATIVVAMFLFGYALARVFQARGGERCDR